MNPASSGWIIAAAAAAIFVLDVFIPLGIAVPMWYIVPILLTWLVPGPRITAITAGCCVVLTMLGIVLSPGLFTTTVAADRFLASTLELVIAWLVIRQKQSARQITEEQQARNESEERLRLAQSAEGFGTFDWDIPGQRVIWSPETERIWGLPVGGFEGTYEHWRRLVHPDDVAEEERMAHLALDNPDISYAYDHRIVRPDGTVRWIHAKATTVRDAAGQPIRMVGVNTDITERKQADQELKRMERLLSDSQRIAHVGGWKAEIESGRGEWTPETYRIYGVSPETFNVTVSNFMSLVHPDDRPPMEEWHRACLAGEWPGALEFRIVRPDGTIRTVVGYGELESVGADTPVAMLGTVQDITERKQAEAALRESEQRFHAIYNHTYEFIGLLTPDGTLIDVNQTAIAFRGLQRADVVGKPFWETPWWDLSHELQEQLKAGIAEAATGKFVRLRAQHRAQDGMIEDIDFSLTPITDRTGKVRQIIPEGRRITPLTRVQDQLRLAYEELEQRVLERTAALTQLNEQLQAEITERMRVQEVLRARSAELQVTLDTAATGLVRNSRELRYRWVNMAYATLVGRRVEDIVGRMLSDVLGAEGLATIRPYIDRVLSGERVEYEAALPISGRGLRWLHVVYMPDRDAAGDVIGWVGSITDITERKQAEETLRQQQQELQQSQTQLQDLTARLLTAQDHERQRIARDLHDDFSQRLAAIVLDMRALERRPPVFPELIPTALKPMREEVEQLANDLHGLAYQLHPSALTHLGLQPAIEDYVQKAIGRTGLRISVKVNHFPTSIPSEWSTCLFRVFQESLQNVVKHARATEVLVSLSASSKGVGLSVIDDGKGFDTRDKSSHQKGLGLTSMQERLRLLHGFLNVHSRPADGTKVCAWIPFQEKTP